MRQIRQPGIAACNRGQFDTVDGGDGRKMLVACDLAEADEAQSYGHPFSSRSAVWCFRFPRSLNTRANRRQWMQPFQKTYFFQYDNSGMSFNGKVMAQPLRQQGMRDEASSAA